MAWFKVDDGLADSPDVVALEESKHFPAAMGLWVLAGSWCAKHLTDGFVPARVVAKLGCKKVHAEALVQAGMWERSEGGYCFHNWLKYQPSRDDVQGKRGAARERMRRLRSPERSREQDANVRDSRPDPTIPDQTDPPQAPQGAGCGVPIGEPPEDLAELSLHELGDAMSVRFRAAWLKARKTSPSMGGRNLGGFAGSVAETAEAQGMDPLELFDRALQRFLAGQLDDVALRAPYACFASRWGQLTDPSGPGESRGRDLAARAQAERAAARAEMLKQLKGFGGSNANG